MRRRLGWAHGHNWRQALMLAAARPSVFPVGARFGVLYDMMVNRDGVNDGTYAR